MGFSYYVQRQIDTILMPHWIRTWWDFVWSWFTLNRVVSLATIFATIFLSRPRNYFPIEFKNPVVIFLVQLCVYIFCISVFFAESLKSKISFNASYNTFCLRTLMLTLLNMNFIWRSHRILCAIPKRPRYCVLLQQWL